MRTIRRTSRYKKDQKREAKSQYQATLASELEAVLTLLANDAALPHRYRDHLLSGEWASFRECHIKPDLLLIYRKPDDQTLELIRLGSHSELGF